MPAGLALDYTVHMEDGTKIEVTVDQRDIAAFELQPFGRSFDAVKPVIFTFMRFTAWHALHRRYKTYKGSWEDFQLECVEVTDVQQSGEVAADPTPADTSAGT